jgi:hypothetical protein
MLQGDTLHGIIPWIDGLSFVGIVVGVVKGSDWLDSMLNDTGRSAITKWLKKVPADAKDESWPNALSELIDNVFGERPFSMKFILRSFIASIIAVSLVYLVYARLQLRTGTPVHEFTGVLTLSLCTSLIPDYLSLLVSRTIILLIPRNPGLPRVLFFLVTDAVLTAITSIVSYVTGFTLYLIVSALFTVGTKALIPTMTGAPVILYYVFTRQFTLSALNLGANSSMRGMAIYFYSSFFTSVWLWLYVIAGFTIQTLRRIRFFWVRVSKYLDIDKQPLGCIGKVSGLVLASLWAIFIGLEHAMHYLRAY